MFLYYRECYSPSISVTLLGGGSPFLLLNIMKRSSPALSRKKITRKHLLAVTFARVSVLVLANVQVHGIWLTDFELLASENNKPIKVVMGVVSIFQTQALL